MSKNYGAAHKTARQRLLDLLWDLEWHEHHELPRVAGVRYSARLLELRRLGYEIEDTESQDGTGKCYRLTSHLKSTPQGKRVKVYLSEREAEALLGGLVSAKDLGSARRLVQDALGSYRHNLGKL